MTATAFKINSMAVDPGGRFLVGGLQSGEIALFEPTALHEIARLQTNLGDLYAVAAHPNRPLLATRGMDSQIALVDVEDPTQPRLIDRFSTRLLRPWNDVVDVPRNNSQSQALCFHPTEPRLATRSASAGVLELDYGGDRFELIHCTRLHGLEDFATAFYPDARSHVLATGALGLVVFSRDGLTLEEVRIGSNNVHWFEAVGDNRYLVATDDRRVLRFDMMQRSVERAGPVFTLDDLEHVHFNKTSGRAFAVGFDRRVYEIDPETCAPIGVVYQAPFKMRWFKTLPDAPDVGYAQCFDGAIYKVDLAAGGPVAKTRRTPPPLWSVCRLPDGRLAATGEGDEIVILHVGGDPDEKRLHLTPTAVLRKTERASYTKRMTASEDGVLFLAQTSGKLLRAPTDGGPCVELADLGSAVRDVAVSADGTAAFVCLEDGRALRLHGESGAVEAQWRSPADMPLWALAYNPARDLLAVGERHGRIRLLDARTLEERHPGPVSKRVKRVQWLDEGTLAYNQEDSLYRYRLEEDHAEEWVTAVGNTIEDFCWSARYGYLIFISYTTQIGLCDFASGERLYLGADQEDYSKGVLCLEDEVEGAYPLEVLTYGRSGRLHGFRPHSEMLSAHGAVTERLLSSSYNE
ncbi:MAG: WD40 repeat domain-containing protein [Marivibrio sp.]|uniref:WD40 repeat domain-containing protein n=1 Tax=Marivibrio sp. TaxID=2039719 RepID=UPI0032EAE70C